MYHILALFLLVSNACADGPALFMGPGPGNSQRVVRSGVTLDEAGNLIATSVAVTDGLVAPAATVGISKIYVDSVTGKVTVKHGDGAVVSLESPPPATGTIFGSGDISAATVTLTTASTYYVATNATSAVMYVPLASTVAAGTTYTVFRAGAGAVLVLEVGNQTSFNFREVYNVGGTVTFGAYSADVYPHLTEEGAEVQCVSDGVADYYCVALSPGLRFGPA